MLALIAGTDDFALIQPAISVVPAAHPSSPFVAWGRASASRARSSVRAVMVIVPELLILAPRLIPASQRRSGDHMSRKG